MNNTPLEFDIELKSVDVILSKKKYTLKELTGKQRDTYFDRQSKRVVKDTDGKSKMGSFDGFQSELLSLCLYDEKGELVPVSFIDSLPSTAQSKLFERAQLLSELTEAKDVKNDSAASG